MRPPVGRGLRWAGAILPAVEVGRRLDPDVWGRGYATEGASRAHPDDR